MTTVSMLRFAVILSLCPVLFMSCTKDNILPGAISTDVTRIPRAPESNLVIQNNSPSAIRVSINNITRGALIGARTADTVKGVPLSNANLVVETVVTDINGNPAGQQLVFQYNLKFPAENDYTKKEINIPPTLFFVNVLNLSAVPATKLVVSAGSTGDMISFMEIENNKKVVACGYYPAGALLANITVVAGNDNVRQWNFTGLTIPGTYNQCIAVTCQ